LNALDIHQFDVDVHPIFEEESEQVVGNIPSTLPPKLTFLWIIQKQKSKLWLPDDICRYIFSMIRVPLVKTLFIYENS